MLAVSTLQEIDFNAEAQLDPAIQFPHPLSRHALNPRAVFLTGATGFLGVYLLEELLRTTEATVFCLVRASDDAVATQRVVQQLQTYGLWKDEFAARIRAVAGDLTEPYFGLTEDRYHELAGQTDVIVHSAGWINMAFPYARLKPTNVTGTQEVLRMAGSVCTKPVHFVSSIAVFFSDAHANVPILRESDTPDYHDSLKGGYSKSKWVADRLVAGAQERGLPTCIYRPVRIMGHSLTGAIHDMSDMLPLLLKGCILLGKYPSFDIEVTLVPVDYVSQAIVHLAGQQESWGRAFHFFNPAPMQWRALMVSLKDLDYPLQEVPYDQWWQELKRRTRPNPEISSDDKAFYGTLLLALMSPHFMFYKRPAFDGRNIQTGLRGTQIACPAFDRDLTATYVAHWQKCGFLPTPSEPRPLY